jgi:phosphinothricin acetyltransferase
MSIGRHARQRANGYEFRLARPSDADGILAIYAPFVESTSVSFEMAVPSHDEMVRRIKRIMRRWPWVVADYEGVLAGYVYASLHRERAGYQWSVDTSVYVHTDFRRLGLGKALYLSLFELLIKQGYFGAFAGIALPNQGSVALHRSVGFRKVGVYQQVGFKMGHWRDVSWWQRELQPRNGIPHAPKSLSWLRRQPDLAKTFDRFATKAKLPVLVEP